MMDMLVQIFIVVIGIIAGFVTGVFFARKPSDGYFVIDDTDDEKTSWVLDVNFDPDKIPYKKSIHLKVKIKK